MKKNLGLMLPFLLLGRMFEGISGGRGQKREHIYRSMPPRIIFKNNSIKYRRYDEFSDEEKNILFEKSYRVFRINNISILAKNLKRAIQTEMRLKYI